MVSAFRDAESAFAASTQSHTPETAVSMTQISWISSALPLAAKASHRADASISNILRDLKTKVIDELEQHPQKQKKLQNRKLLFAFHTNFHIFAEILTPGAFAYGVGKRHIRKDVYLTFRSWHFETSQLSYSCQRTEATVDVYGVCYIQTCGACLRKCY